MPANVCGEDDELRENLQRLQRQFRFNNQQLRRIMATMTNDMKKALCGAGSDASFAMLLSHVNCPLTLTGNGSYLALDLGGTNFRLLLIDIRDSGCTNRPADVNLVTEVYALPENVLIDGESFFDHIAKCMALFCRLNGVNTGRTIPVGFTFSFPLRQEHLSHAVLIDWAKGFDVTGVIGNDIVEMLQKSLRKRDDINCEIVAVINDTVATLVSCAHLEPSCKIGLIVGNGCNACYMEKSSNVPGIQDHDDGQMCINMEWGSFGNNGVLEEYRNEYDREIDSNSNNPNRRVYEKMICGRYMGELVRRVLYKLWSEKAIFNGQDSQRLSSEGSFLTAFVYQIENPNANHNFGPYHTIRNILSTFGLVADDADSEMVKQICHLVSARAAHLCAAGVAAVALKIKGNYPEKERLTIAVAVDGTIYKKHPTFSQMLREKVDELCEGSGVTINFTPSYDGSGKGAALVAAAMHQRSARLPTSTLHNGLILPKT